MRGFFALTASTSVLRAASGPRFCGGEATHSLRPSAGGATESPMLRTRAVALRASKAAPPAFPVLGAPGRRRPRMGLAPAVTSSRVPAIEEDCAVRGSPFRSTSHVPVARVARETRATRALRSPFRGGPASSLRPARGGSPASRPASMGLATALGKTGKMPLSNLCNRRQLTCTRRRSDSGNPLLTHREGDLSPGERLDRAKTGRVAAEIVPSRRRTAFDRHPAPGDDAHDSAPPASACRAKRPSCKHGDRVLGPARRFRPQPDALVRASDTRCRAAAHDPKIACLDAENGFPTKRVIASWFRRSGCLPSNRPVASRRPKASS